MPQLIKGAQGGEHRPGHQKVKLPDPLAAHERPFDMCEEFWQAYCVQVEGFPVPQVPLDLWEQVIAPQLSQSAEGGVEQLLTQLVLRFELLVREVRGRHAPVPVRVDPPSPRSDTPAVRRRFHIDAVFVAVA